jgi:hypothetical protein
MCGGPPEDKNGNLKGDKKYRLFAGCGKIITSGSKCD